MDGGASRYGTLIKTPVLVGMMGSGKTAVGGALAGMLGARFFDSDREIEAAAGVPVAEIFSRGGEALFRDMETRTIERLLGGTPAVVSVGGGAFMSERNRDLIARMGVSVHLEADLELLWDRVRGKTTRPLLMTADPKATLSELLAERAPIYGKARVKVKADAAYSVAVMAEKVARALGDEGILEDGR